MGKIDLTELKPGMVLSADVALSSIGLLLAAGEAVTEKHINIFRKWGVPQVEVKGVTRDEIQVKQMEQWDAEILQKADKRVSDLFCRTSLENPFISELKRLCLVRLVERRAGGHSS
jgi:hypothetical protein